MAKIVTENFKVETTTELYKSFLNDNETAVSQFQIDLNSYNSNEGVGLSSTVVDSITDLVRVGIDQYLPENTYYVFASKIDKENDINNSQFEKREFQRRVIFGKKVSTASIKYMFGRIPWAQNVLYDAFDDRADIELLNMFVTVPDGEQNEGPYKVFKCIANGNRAISTVKPSVNSLDPTIEVTLGDGYVWKYMFSIPVSEYAEYSTLNSLPYVPDVSVLDNANEDISNILIEESITGLFSGYKPGTMRLQSIVSAAGANRYELEFITGESSPRSGRAAYTNMYIRFDTDGKVYNILDSRVISAGQNNKTLYITIESTVNPRDLYEVSIDDAEIVPKIAITPSNDATSGINAVAYARTDANGTVDEVIFSNKGDGYKYATAKIMLPPSLALDYLDPEDVVRFRVVVSPKGGHGADPISELYMSRLAITTNFFSEVGINIPDNGAYTTVGLIKNPQFVDGIYSNTIDNRMRIVVDGTPIATVGQLLVEVQPNQTVYAKIHQVTVENGSSVLYLVDYTGDYNSTFTEGATVQVKDTLLADEFENVTINNNSGSVIQGKYVPFTGDILHFVDFGAIERLPDRKEKIKFVFDF